MNHSPQEGHRTGADLTALLTDAPDPTDHERVRKYVHALAEAGLAVLFVWPNAKVPADMRTPQRKTADDKAARKAARDTGRRDWHKVKSPAGLTLATTDTDVLDGYLHGYVKAFASRYPDGVPVNLAVEVGGSGLVVVDCDTREQLAAFLADAGADLDTPPTVRSPGQRGPGGEWVHSDGGHFWFVVPEDIELPSSPGAMTVGATDDDPARYSVLWDRRYVLIPPSVRAEGAYTVAGEVHPLPEPLADRIAEYAQRRVERASRVRTRPADGNPVESWGASVTWAEILDGCEWMASGRVDSCGCDVWTAPGPHASPKSATAHEPGCGQWTDSPDPPLQIWTDHDVEPFGRRVADNGRPTVSRLEAVAAIYYDDKLGAAMDDLGIETTDIEAMAVDLPADFGKVAPSGEASDQAQTRRRLRVTWASEIEPAPVKWLWVDVSTHNAGTVDPYRLKDIACVAEDHTWTPPEVETEGRIACGMVSVAAGREGSGKSSFGIWLAAKMTRGELPGAHYGTPRRVYYLATEDSWQHTLVPRLMASGADLSMIARVEVVVNRSDTLTLCLPDDVGLLADSIAEHDVALVVVDPLMSTINDSLSTNNTREVRTALEPLAAMADQTGASVVCIAHFNKATGLDAASRISGSGAFKDLARAVIVFAVGPDGERVFSQPKNSVGRNDLPSLSYAVEGAVVDTPTGKAATAVLRFTGQAEHSVEDMLADERGRNRRKSDVMTFLVDYITEHAEEQSGEVPAADVIAAGTDRGFTENQIKLARRRCDDPKIATRREGFGEDGKTFWRLDVAG